MAKTLTVILGAGASYSINIDPRSTDNQGYRSPLAQQIFKDSREFRQILHKYEQAEILSSDIERRIRQNKLGVGLEQILRDLEEELKRGNDTHKVRQFLQIPLYIQELFGVISSNFTQRPDEYNILVNEVLSKVGKVLFLVLNYDNLLEIPLSKISHTEFSTEEDYIKHEPWMLAKIHGSINWSKEFIDVKHADPSDNEYFRLLATSKLPLPLSDKFSIWNMRSYAVKYADRIPLYPAITVPVDGKYDVNCPHLHIQKAKEFLSDCHNYLIIGTSGKDQDLLDMLKTNAKGGKVLVVGTSEENTNMIRENFVLAIPQFQSNIGTFYHQRGFSEFVDSGTIDIFLDSLV